jgi:hypothetical protein
MAATEYVILALRPGHGEFSTGTSQSGPVHKNAAEPDAWIEVARAEGATPQAAIKAATNGKPAAERTGTFVACPVRSWKPMTRRVENVEKESWE